MSKRILEICEECHSVINGDDAETKLSEILSLICFIEDGEPSPQLAQIWQILSNRNNIPLPSEMDNPWEISLSLLASLIRIPSPFEVHSISSQSLVFLEKQSNLHPVLCLMLCAWCLTQCPSNPKRWKRWQSILCETIRLFQVYHKEEWEVELWIMYLMPSFHQVNLPTDACHAGILAGKIGTSLSLIANHPDHLSRIQISLKHLIDIQEILLHPWSISRLTNSTISNQTYKLMLENLAWWSEVANCHDLVSSMDTSWNKTGISLLAWEQFVFKTTLGTILSPRFNSLSLQRE
jgi:hypothetical protein